jgi:hypothetical protein
MESLATTRMRVKSTSIRIESRSAELVVLFTLLGVREQLVGLLGFDELLTRPGLFVGVRVVLLS